MVIQSKCDYLDKGHFRHSFPDVAHSKLYSGISFTGLSNHPVSKPSMCKKEGF